MVLEVLTYPNKILSQNSKEVTNFDENLHKLLDDMYETMLAYNGVGLAAIQVGQALRALVINPINEEGKQDKADLLEIINPKIIYEAGECLFDEGCLSVPGYYEEIARAQEIEIEYFDRFGEKKNIRNDGFLARAILHEMDHLNGHLFIEKLNFLQRKLFNKTYLKKAKKAKK